MNLSVFIEVCRNIPVALFKGYYRVDERYCVRGFAARLIGLCFLTVAISVVGMTVFAATQSYDFALVGFLLFFGAALVALVVCAACKQKIAPMREPRGVTRERQLEEEGW